MKYAHILAYILLTQACSLAVPEKQQNHQSSEGIAKQYIAQYLADYPQLGIPNLKLSYVDNIKSLGTESDLIHQLTVIKAYRDKAPDNGSKNVSLCVRLDLSRVASEIDLGIERAELGLVYLKSQPEEMPSGGLYTLASGRAWYRYFLKAYLGAEVSLDKLYQFGESELAKAVNDYRLVQKSMGFGDDEEGFVRHMRTDPLYVSSDHAEILRRYRDKQNSVRAKLPLMFKHSYEPPLTDIIKSDKGMAFPAAGWRTEQGFYYNVFADSYDLRQMDWLFLHEATPGHHYSAHIAKNKNHCVSSMSLRAPSAYHEGWAAYVETLGETLGLYQTPWEKLSAIEWNMIRSARVVLDIAINYYGWSDMQALAYWKDNVIGQDDKAMREINRMKNWPAQVITYKYGAEVFTRMKTQYLALQGKKADVKEYHDLALAYGAMPLSTFEWLVFE